MTRYNCATLPAALRAVQNDAWNVPGAIAELVDNSLGKGRGNAKTVKIYHDTKARLLTVMDNGRGMKHIGDLFQDGKGAGSVADDIGEYGAGGTRAILWLASKVEIWTLRSDMVMHDVVTWAQWFKAPSFEHLDVSDDWEYASLRNTPAELLAAKHGTLIQLHLLPGRIVRPSSVIRELGKKYSPGIRNGKQIIWSSMRNGEEIESTPIVDPFVAPVKTGKTKNFDLVVTYGEVSLPVHGVVYYDENTPQARSEIHIGYGHRIIFATKDCFNSPDGAERYSGVGVSGWLDLGETWKPFLTTRKDDISLEELKKTLMGHVFESIRDMLKDSETSALTIYLDDLLVGFQKALRAKPGAYEAELAAAVKTKRKQPEYQIVKRDGPGPEEWPEPKNKTQAPEQDGSGKVKQKAPPQFALKLEKRSDVQMTRHLCRATVSTDGITVFVNQDHSVVQEALKDKPVNRLALNAITLCEIANVIADEKNCQSIVKALFPPMSATALEELEGRELARSLARCLIDRVRDPVPLDPEDNEEAEAA